MHNQQFTLDIISHHKQFANKCLRKYYVDGIDTIGAWGDESFEIRFKNNTRDKVQVKLSVDGTDVLSGKPANTEVSKDMWVVNGYATLSLKAFPETNNGGAGFVFTSADKSVAVHTHGDLSSRGIIAAAVFVESHVEPIKILPPVIDHHHHYYGYPYATQPWTITCNDGRSTIRSRRSSSGGSGSSTLDGVLYSNDSQTFSSSVIDGNNLSEEQNTSASLEKLVAVGAGQYVDQKIAYVTGLIKPKFSQTVRVRYLWWDELVGKLRTESAATAQPSGFPGDKDKKNIDLGSTPRIGVVHRVDAPVQEFSRV